MKISQDNIERIVENHLDGDFMKDLLESRNKIINAFNNIVNENNTPYNDLEIEDDILIDVIFIAHVKNREKLKDAITNSFMDNRLPASIIIQCPNLKKLICKLSGINITNFCVDITNIIVDCMDNQIAYIGRDSIIKVIDLFTNARADLEYTRKLLSALIDSENSNKSLFGKKKRKQLIINYKELMELLDKTISNLDDIVSILRESTDMLLDLTSDLFFKVEGFNKILK